MASTPTTRRRVLPLLGPAFVAALAYVDPGNVAANITAGSRYGGWAPSRVRGRDAPLSDNRRNL